MAGLEPDRQRISAHLSASLMLVTALVPYIGYDRAAEIAHHAAATGSTLRDAALELGDVDADDYDAWVDLTAMTRPG